MFGRALALVMIASAMISRASHRAAPPSPARLLALSLLRLTRSPTPVLHAVLSLLCFSGLCLSLLCLGTIDTDVGKIEFHQRALPTPMSPWRGSLGLAHMHIGWSSGKLQFSAPSALCNSLSVIFGWSW
jgi:hypothetical protein